MIAVIQRVSESKVSIEEKEVGCTGLGLCILLGVGQDDEEEDVAWLTSKIAGMRIFNDDSGKMNLSVNDVQGDCLVISQFTLHAQTKKGNRPSFTEAARPDKAIPMYESFLKHLDMKVAGKIESGEFGADMQVSLTNNGPVTIIIDTKNRK